MTYGQARGALPLGLDELLTSQMVWAISEANLGRENERIARRAFLDRAAQIDIAVELGYDRSVISRRISKTIAPRVSSAAKHWIPPQ